MQSSRRNLVKGLTASAALLPITGWARPSESRQALPYVGRFPNVLLTTQEGRSVRFYDDILHGKIVLINAMYTSCNDVCPVGTAALVRLQQALGGQVGKTVHIYSLSLQPDIDTPERLRAYARQHNVGPGWTFLTGKAHEMDAVRRALGFFDPDPREDQKTSRHTGMVRIGNVPRNRWAVMPALASVAKFQQILARLS